MINRRAKAHLAVLGANFIFGANFSVVKYVTPAVIHPLALNVVRILTTTLLFWMFFAIKPSPFKIHRQDVWRFIICGATGVAFNQLLFINGLSLTTSIHAALLMLATPIFITFIAAWLLKERLNTMKFLGLALGVGGAMNLILQKEAVQTATDMLRGDIYVLINAMFYGYYLVMVRPLMEKYSSLQVIRMVFTVGLFFILPFGWSDFVATDWGALDSGHWAALAFIVFASTFLAYLFNVFGVSVIGASATGAYIYTQPVFAAIIAIIFMGEEVSFYKALSALLIFTGVYLVNMRPRPAK